jgi:hypothetical protein
MFKDERYFADKRISRINSKNSKRILRINLPGDFFINNPKKNTEKVWESPRK